jgi:hypothetical protein
MSDNLRCPVCGYSQEDADIHGDHGLCLGKIPTAMTCDNCGDSRTIPGSVHHVVAGQFMPDGQWVCCESCRQELIQSLSMNGGVPQDG